MAYCLVTGFEWFVYEGVVYEPNPSGVVAESLDGLDLGSCRVVGVALPVEPGCIDMLRRLLVELEPIAVVSLGLYTPGSKWLRLEAAAVNAVVWRGGVVEPVDPDRPLYEPVHAPVDVGLLARLLSQRGFEAKPSLSTGLYACNAVAYTVYRWGLEEGRPTVFIHTPYSTRLAERLGVDKPAVPEHMLREAALEALRMLAEASKALAAAGTE